MNPKSQKKQKKFEQQLGPALMAFLQHQKINIQLLQIARALVDLMWGSSRYVLSFTNDHPRSLCENIRLQAK
jgi:hypothetical protein